MRLLSLVPSFVRLEISDPLGAASLRHLCMRVCTGGVQVLSPGVSSFQAQEEQTTEVMKAVGEFIAQPVEDGGRRWTRET